MTILDRLGKSREMRRFQQNAWHIKHCTSSQPRINSTHYVSSNHNYRVANWMGTNQYMQWMWQLKKVIPSLPSLHSVNSWRHLETEMPNVHRVFTAQASSVNNDTRGRRQTLRPWRRSWPFRGNLRCIENSASCWLTSMSVLSRKLYAPECQRQKIGGNNLNASVQSLKISARCQFYSKHKLHNNETAA